jgi:hypothetical protein
MVMLSLLGRLAFSIPKEIRLTGIENSDRYYTPEVAKDRRGKIFLRRKGANAVYQIIGRSMQCTSCGSSVEVGMAEHTEPYCWTEKVPYCPKCERDITFDEKPLIEGDVSVSELIPKNL